MLRASAARVVPLVELAARVHQVGLEERTRKRFRASGETIGFDPRTIQADYESVTLGDRVSLGSGMRIWGELIVGDDVMFGPDVYVMGRYHRTDVVGKTLRESGGDERRAVVIEDDVWIGARAILLKGVRIGTGSVIGAASMVRSDVPPFVIAAGVPCRPRKLRFTDDQLVRHITQRGYDGELARTFIARRRRELDDLGLGPSNGSHLYAD